MKLFHWNHEKNKLLQDERKISFEDIVFHIIHGDLLAVMKHPNHEKYPNQKIFVVKVEDYAWLVPFVEDEETIFLKTVIPSRKATKQYLRKGKKHGKAGS